MSDRDIKYFIIEPRKLFETGIVGNIVRKKGKSYYKGVAYNNAGSLYIGEKFGKDWLLKKCVEEREENSYYNLSIEIKNSINSLEKKNNIKLFLPGYTFKFEPKKQPLLLIGEMLNRDMVLGELSINYCSKDYADGENYGFHTFDNINKELQKHKTASQIPVLVYDEYKIPAIKTTKEIINIHLVSMFFNQACATGKGNKDFIIVDSLLDYVEKDEQLFKGLEQIFATELFKAYKKDKNQFLSRYIKSSEGIPTNYKKKFLRNKLKESSLYQYPIQSENNCGRFAVKFYARFADCNDLNEIRAKSRETLLEVCSEISDEVTKVTRKQEPSIIKLNNNDEIVPGYAKVNIGDKTFAVRIPKPEELKFDNQSLPGYQEYSGSEGTFHEKGHHGQGVLTGGVLLNLGVSREQLKYMVNDRDKPIEITVKEPIPPSNYSHSPSAIVKFDGKLLLQTSECSYLDTLNHEKIKKKLEQQYTDVAKSFKKKRRGSTPQYKR